MKKFLICSDNSFPIIRKRKMSLSVAQLTAFCKIFHDFLNYADLHLPINDKLRTMKIQLNMLLDINPEIVYRTLIEEGLTPHKHQILNNDDTFIKQYQQEVRAGLHNNHSHVDILQELTPIWDQLSLVQRATIFSFLNKFLRLTKMS